MNISSLRPARPYFPLFLPLLSPPSIFFETFHFRHGSSWLFFLCGRTRYGSTGPTKRASSTSTNKIISIINRERLGKQSARAELFTRWRDKDSEREIRKEDGGGKEEHSNNAAVEILGDCFIPK